MMNLTQHPSWGSRTWLTGTNGALVLALVLVQAIFATQWSQAQVDTTFALLYSFRGKADGYDPNGSLLRDSAGNLYGTTYFGGTSSICPALDGIDLAQVGCGTVFKLDSTGTHTVLHHFSGPPLDGRYPSAGLVRGAN